MPPDEDDEEEVEEAFDESLLLPPALSRGGDEGDGHGVEERDEGGDDGASLSPRELDQFAVTDCMALS